MPLSSVPPVAASLIATTDCVLHIAPVSKAWKADAPSNVVFLPPTLTRQTLLLQIALLRPTTIVVGDQVIDAEVIAQWRVSHPFGDLNLIRRGTSLDKVQLDLCKANGIRVVNTPGINAPHVAAYIAHWLTLADGSMPADVRVLGYGNVGKELVKLLLDRDPDVRIKVLVRHGRAPDTHGEACCDCRVSFVVDWSEALEGATAVAICLALNDDSTHRIDPVLIQGMQERARLVCVAKPDVFSEDALHALAVAEGVQLILDYGPTTLDAFRIRTQTLGCDVSTWRNPATLTTQAATTEACNCDLDYAVCVQLSLTALRGLVRRKLAHSLTIPSLRVCTGAPRVSIIGRGINGLLQALMLRLANYHVVVYEGNQQSDGAGHKRVNMRHLSMDTTAKPTHNDYLLSRNQCLTGEYNRAGTQLLEKLRADNPSLGHFAQVSDYDEEIHLEDALEALLQRSGVQFRPQRLDLSQIAELSKEHFVVSAADLKEGLSIVYRSAYNRIADGATYTGSMTQGLVWASLVQEIIQANAKLNEKNGHDIRRRTR
ncbi:NAD(P)-dependent oxidoreductase [Pseudomonas cedrina]|uniref:NAD(P)-dependent oxidoreductase n=1 Tax=Pseudomonas cedrina TaxID=651740 RepID=UPI00277F32E6|nr:NAD(P)-dependent oxidoreductase [Pseudomonas cedrina]MDQ0653107.1 lactate dehydrogenase-like 2-hydroxyacid dehydrogenase [Pseudomonas cedrina]